MWKRRSHILAPLTDLIGKGKKKIEWNGITKYSRNSQGIQEHPVRAKDHRIY